MRKVHCLNLAVRTVCVLAISLVVMSPALAAADQDSARHSHCASLMSASDYLDTVGYLASNELGGRGPGQEGIDKAANFIAGKFRQFGVQPAGDDNTFFQNFTLPLKNAIGEDTFLSVGVKGRKTRRRLSLQHDYVPLPFSGSGRFKGEVVFAGYGIVNDRREYDDYEDIDVSGKVVLVFRSAPEYARFARRDYDLVTKAYRASARDALAMIVVNPAGEGDDELWDFDKKQSAIFSMARESCDFPIFHIRRSVVDKWLKAAGMPDIEQLEDQIEDTERPASNALQGVSVRGCADVTIQYSPVKNVVGIIPGSGPQADEYIVLGGHYDHHGIRNKGTAEFDPERDIYNGADDNASGTVMMLSLARAFTQGHRPNRSILLLAFTGEELGLHGSRYYTDHPTVDLDKCVAMLNFDMVGRLYENQLQIGGIQTGDFEDMLEELAEPYGITIVEGGGGASPSDHTWFYRHDIPVMFFHTGIHEQYTQPEDDTHYLNAAGAIRVARLAADCVDAIDSNREPPPFHEDTSRMTLLQTHDQDILAERAAAYRQRRASNRVFLGVKRNTSNGGDGFLVAEVIEGTPAQRAGLKKDDLIVKLGEKAINRPGDLVAALRGLSKNERTSIQVRRGGKIVTLTVDFGEPAAHAKPVAHAQPAARAQPASRKELIKGIAKLMDFGTNDVVDGVEWQVWARTRRAMIKRTLDRGQSLEQFLNSLEETDFPTDEIVEIGIETTDSSNAAKISVSFKVNLNDTEQEGSSE